ncbi:MAG: PQQ-binding-like beta-propeller repeat protein [Saprospiraceae bacterium]|nr:PQQ-binding-like beta-propeller repeat protein [Saprospiraceae bacterium]
MKYLSATALCLLTAVLSVAQPLSDWPQWQRDPARTGRTTASVAPPFRARWFWLGPELTLRNNAVNAAWPDNLETSDGYSFPVPEAYTVTLAKGVQPVAASGRIYIGDMQGYAYAIAATDGATLWSYNMGDAVITTACADALRVLFVDVFGDAVALDASTGQPQWTFTADRSITTAPLLLAGRVFLADHGGTVYCINWQTGTVIWTVHLPAPVQGQLASTSERLFVPSENMTIYALDVSSGDLLVENSVTGQSFRMTHPVVFQNKLWVTTCQIPAVGSEDVFDDVLDQADSFEEEEALTRAFLRGEGNFSAASSDWQHLFALDTATLDTTFLIPNGPIEGVGYPLAGAGITHDDKVVTWFRTRFPTLTHDNPCFGTDYSIDIAAINPQNGNRIRIDNGVFSGMFPGPETDNLYIFSSGGEYLWYRQNFRGTQVIHLPSSQHTFAVASVRYRDGGQFFAHVVPYNTSAEVPAAAQRSLEGKAAAVILDNIVLLTETGGILAIEHKN